MMCDAFMKKDEDSIIIFSGSSQYTMNKQIVGKERADIDIFL